MADIVDSATRSQMMGGIKGKDTRPELLVRRFLHGHGFRYRLHHKNLPGKPDIVLPKYRAVIFVNGCYWHRHRGCKLAYEPKTRREFWQAKFQGNVERDKKARQDLLDAGWRVMTIWECGLRKNAVREKGLEEISEWLKGEWRTGEYPHQPLQTT